MNITKQITMNLMEPQWIRPIDVVQNDLNTRKIEIALYAGTEPWIIPADACARMRYSKADGKGGEYELLPDGTIAWSLTDNILTLMLAPQMLTTPGPVSLTVSLIRQEERLSCFQIFFHVHPITNATGGDSEEYFNVTGFLPAPVDGAVGQYLAIAELDPNGRVYRVEAVTPETLESFLEKDGIGFQQNSAQNTNVLWTQWDSRLAFGMDTENAPVPFLINGQLLCDGTIIAKNSGTKDKNRHGYHVYEAYAKDNHSRMTLLLDKHSAEADGKPSMELYYYTGANHFAASYGNTKIGSDVAFHSFCFDRDKLTAYGEIDCSMPVTLARISLSKDLDSTYATVREADMAYEPEAAAAQNMKCLKYLALRNARNGAMFYDTDRNRPVMKINGQWCALPFAPIEDAEYDILYDDGIVSLDWESGVYNQRGESVSNSARLRLVDYLPSTVSRVSANDGYEFAVLFLDENHWSDNEAYYNAATETLQHSAVYYTSLELGGIQFDAYPNIKLIARRTDLAVIDPSEGINIVCR